MTDINGVADSIFVTFKAYCSKEVDRRVAKSHELLLARIAEIPAGKDGAPGPQGETGKDGRDGVDGKDGTNGLDGKDGAAGLNGADGKDGAPGINGKDGADGIDGKDGAAGLNGKDGAPGIDGKDGAAGISVKGEDGRDGRDGKEGAPGRDALRLDVLDAIDLERSYVRGTYAAHDGGLVRAYRTTDPIGAGGLEKAGWQIIVEGFKAVTFEDVDERAAKISVQFTSGKRVEHVVRVPGISHRGVWKAGTAYARGDLVTWGGSLWHCERATEAKPQEIGSEDWKLSIKKGRDGEDGKPGERGMQGPPGAPGRDLTNLGTRIT